VHFAALHYCTKTAQLWTRLSLTLSGTGSKKVSKNIAEVRSVKNQRASLWHRAKMAGIVMGGGAQGAAKE